MSVSPASSRQRANHDQFRVTSLPVGEAERSINLLRPMVFGGDAEVYAMRAGLREPIKQMLQKLRAVSTTLGSGNQIDVKVRGVRINERVWPIFRGMDVLHQLLVRFPSRYIEGVARPQHRPPGLGASALQRSGVQTAQQVAGNPFDVDAVREIGLKVKVRTNKDFTEQSRIIKQASAIGSSVAGEKCNVVERIFIGRHRTSNFHDQLLSLSMLRVEAIG